MSRTTASLRALVEERSGQRVFRCYQCGNCSAGCPVAGRGDLMPHQVVRALQMGEETAAGALQPWLCVGCQTCATRCPQEFDLSLVMDALRAEALRRHAAPRGARHMRVFNQIFVRQVMADGRLSEVKLGAAYNLLARAPFQNLGALPGMLRRGKLKLGGGVGAWRRAVRTGGGK